MEKHIYGDPEASKVLLQLTDSLEGLEREAEYIKNDYGDGFCLMALMVNDWDSDLSPWEAPPVFGDRAFAGKAKETLAAVLEEIVDKDKDYYIGGYSLAGLFALWSVYQSDAFKGAACASPSVWFPDFSDYITDNRIKTGLVYLSLGDKEEKTRNQIMSTVGERIRSISSHLLQEGTRCTLEWNEGNHFKDADIRTAKAFTWLLHQQ